MPFFGWRQTKSIDPNLFWHFLFKRILLLGALMFLFLLSIPIGQQLYQIYERQLNHYPIASSTQHPEYHSTIEEILHTIQTLEPEVPGKESFLFPITSPRIGIRSNTYESCIPIIYGFGIVPPPYMPTMMLYTRSMWRDDAAGTYSQMKYFFGRGNRRYAMDVDGITPYQTFGQHVLYKNDLFSDKPFHVLSPMAGDAELRAMEPNQMTIECRDFEKASWIRFPITRYRKWHAYQNEDPIAIQAKRLPNEPPSVERFIAVQANSGELELRYENEWIDILGYFLSGGSLLLFVLFLLFPNPLFIRLQHAVVICVLIMAVLSMLLFAIKTAGSSNQFWFLGVMLDKVGTTELSPDRKQDLQFALKHAQEMNGKQLVSVQIEIVDPLHSQKPVQVASTQPHENWKIVLDRYRPDLQRWIQMKLPFTLQNHLMIYMGNPYRDRYVPKGTIARIELQFQDETHSIFECKLPSRYNY